MATLGPHTPKKGWALRWTRQALALTVAAPMAFVSLAASVLALGTLGLAAHQVVTGLGGVAVSAALAALALLPAALVSNALLAADGLVSRRMSELWAITRPILLPVFAVAGAQGLLAILAGAPSFGSDLVAMSELEAALALGLGAYLGAATVLTVLNVFWLGASAALGLAAAEAWSLEPAGAHLQARGQGLPRDPPRDAPPRPGSDGVPPGGWPRPPPRLPGLELRRRPRGPGRHRRERHPRRRAGPGPDGGLTHPRATGATGCGPCRGLI